VIDVKFTNNSLLIAEEKAWYSNVSHRNTSRPRIRQKCQSSEREREIESLRGDMGSPKDYDEVYARLSKHVTPEKSVSPRSIGPFSHKPTTPGRGASRKVSGTASSQHTFHHQPELLVCVPSREACDSECIKKS